MSLFKGIVSLTKSQYNALATKDADTLYVTTDEIATEVPAYSASDAGKVLSVNAQGALEWAAQANQYKVAEGTFAGSGGYSTTITHNLGTQNVIVFIQAFNSDGTPVVGASRYRSVFLVAFSDNFIKYINQKYKMGDSGSEQTLVQRGFNSFFGAATATATTIGNDQAFTSGLTTTDNNVTVNNSIIFSDGFTFHYRVIGFMDGV